MSLVLEIIISISLLLGAGFALVGSIGLARLPDFYMRLHGPTKASTLGVGGMIIGSLIFFSTRGEGVSLHEILIAIFLFITAPVSAHIVGKAALHLQLPVVERTRGLSAINRGASQAPVPVGDARIEVAGLLPPAEPAETGRLAASAPGTKQLSDGGAAGSVQEAELLEEFEELEKGEAGAGG